MRSGIHLRTLRGTLHNYDYTRFYQTFVPLEGFEPSSSAKPLTDPTTLTKTLSPSVGSSCCSPLHHKGK